MFNLSVFFLSRNERCYGERYLEISIFNIAIDRVHAREYRYSFALLRERWLVAFVHHCSLQNEIANQKSPDICEFTYIDILHLISGK